MLLFLFRLVFFQYLDNLTDKDPVQVVAGIVLVQNPAVQETAFLHILLVELTADEHQLCFLIVGGRLVKGRGQAGLRVLVAVPAGFGAAELQGVPVFLVEKAKGVKILFLHEFQGVPLGADVNGGYIFPPQLAYAAPTGSHGVVLPLGAGGNQHPALIDEGKGIDSKGFDGSFAK